MKWTTLSQALHFCVVPLNAILPSVQSTIRESVCLNKQWNNVWGTSGFKVDGISLQTFYRERGELARMYAFTFNSRGRKNEGEKPEWSMGGEDEFQNVGRTSDRLSENVATDWSFWVPNIGWNQWKSRREKKRWLILFLSLCDNWGITTFYCISRSSFALTEYFLGTKFDEFWQFGTSSNLASWDQHATYIYFHRQLKNMVGSLVKVSVSWLEHSIIEKRVQLHWNLSCFTHH